LASLQAASCTYRIALGPRAGQKVLSLRAGDSRDEQITRGLCADAHGFSLYAAVRVGSDQRKQLERLCRTIITRPALAGALPDGLILEINAVLQPVWRSGAACARVWRSECV